MINWRDTGLIIDFRRHGETSAIIEIFSKEHGKYSGMVRGGASRNQAPSLQAGHVVTAEFTARLEEHLGTLKIETLESHVAMLLADPLRLSVFQSMSALIKFGMSEHDPHPLLYDACLNCLTSDQPMLAYVQWELTLLSEAGFHLELDKCAVTGARENLEFVSPKTGRAVTRLAAGNWIDQLLPYSTLFAGDQHGNCADALKTTGYFLTHWLAQMVGKSELPQARARVLEHLTRV